MFASIFGLDIANGIKEVLVNQGFTLEALLKTPPAELAIILGIDLYVARLIHLAARRHATIDKFQYDINQEEVMATAKAKEANVSRDNWAHSK